MNIRDFDVEKDYNTIIEWGQKQGWPMMPPSYYGIKGYITEQDGIPVAAAFVYRDHGCPICILEWVIGNPDIEWEVRRDGINKVIDSCFEWAKNDGAEVVLTMTKNKRLIEKYKEKEFVETDSEMTHLIRRL